MLSRLSSIVLLAPLLLAGCGGGPTGPATGQRPAGLPAEGPTRAPAGVAAAEVGLKVVKYGQLIDAIRDLKGKVVVVDIWGEF